MTSSIIHHTCWRKTIQGTAIELYKKSHTLSRPLLFVGGVHGDEPEGVALASGLIEWLKSQPHQEKLWDWALIPCINPDGYKINQRTNSRGVDLNRNFPSQDWSPEHKAPRYFPGSEPNSEEETKALVDLIYDIRPIAIVHFHSWQPCVVYTGEPGRPYAEILGSGTPYEVREDIGYPTPGSLGQYGWLEHKTPVICIEEQEHSPLDQVWPRFKEGLIKLLHHRPGDF